MTPNNSSPNTKSSSNSATAQQKKTRPPMSLASRVMLFVAVAVFVCSVALGSLLQSAIKEHFAEQDAEELQVVADSVRKILQNNNISSEQLPSALALAVVGHHGVYFQVSANTQTLYQSPGSDLAWLLTQVMPQQAVDAEALASWQSGDKTFRGTVIQGPAQSKIAVATEIDFHLHFLHHFNDALWLTVAGSVVLTLFAAWLGVRQGLAPLKQFSDNITQVRADRLQLQLDPATSPDELRDLVHAFNQMMSRLEHSFQQLSNFSADIAHELRTPLTNMITQTQVSLGKDRSAEQYRDLLYSNLEEQERLAAMVSDMLWLAKTDHGLIKPAFKPLNLRTEIQVVFDFFESLAEDKQLKLQLSGDVPPLPGDKDMLRRAFSNLLSNAIRHASTHSIISAELSYAAVGGFKITLSNYGDAIAPAHLANLFDRFYRVDPSRQRQGEGAGLGLAIVKSIVELHGGTIAALSKPVASDAVAANTVEHISRPDPALISFVIAISPSSALVQNH
jgi:two-component system heavy metal sensor histidine kinase CusS